MGFSLALEFVDFWDRIGLDPYQGTTSVVLSCQPAGNDSNENKELRPVFSGVPTVMAGIKALAPAFGLARYARQ